MKTVAIFLSTFLVSYYVHVALYPSALQFHAHCYSSDLNRLACVSELLHALDNAHPKVGRIKGN